MDILFNKKMLKHNPSIRGEGSYRLKDFLNWSENIEFNGYDFLSLVYHDRYIKKIMKACENRSLLAEVNLSPDSLEAIYLAVGLSVLATEQNNFAIVRPPGHHAGFNRAGGFCLFNNIAIATQKLVNEGKEVCLIDIDGHHGNGTQEIFYKSDKVLYCSIHQQSTYPGTGLVEEIGEGVGRGYNLNLPIAPNSGDDIFLAAIMELLPFIKKFNPDVVGVSAGFDGYYQDESLELSYTLNSYFELGKILSQNFKNIFAVLEGGYHQNIKKCTDVFIAGIDEREARVDEEKTYSSLQCQNVFNRNTETLKELLG